MYINRGLCISIFVKGLLVVTLIWVWQSESSREERRRWKMKRNSWASWVSRLARFGCPIWQDWLATRELLTYARVCGEFGILTSIAQILVEHARVWRILIGRRVADARSSRTLLTAVGTSRTEKKERKKEREKPMRERYLLCSTRRLDWPFMSALSRAIYAREIYARGSRNGRLIRYILRSTHETLLREERMWRGFSYLFAENSTAPRLMGKIWLWDGWSLTAPRLAMLFIASNNATASDNPTFITRSLDVSSRDLAPDSVCCSTDRVVVLSNSENVLWYQVIWYGTMSWLGSYLSSLLSQTLERCLLSWHSSTVYNRRGRDDFKKHAWSI